MHSDATVCVREKEAAQQLREGTAQVCPLNISMSMAWRKVAGIGFVG